MPSFQVYSPGYNDLHYLGVPEGNTRIFISSENPPPSDLLYATVYNRNTLDSPVFQELDQVGSSRLGSLTLSDTDHGMTTYPAARIIGEDKTCFGFYTS